MNVNRKGDTSKVNGYLFLTEASEKDKYWDINKGENCIATSYTQGTDFDKHSLRMCNCANSLLFKLLPNKTGLIDWVLENVFLCKVRECPNCTWLRARVWQKRLNAGIPLMVEANPKVKFLFLTLTVKNCHVKELRTTLDAMNHAFKKLLLRTKVNNYVKGYLRAVEVTKNKDGTAHPHFHVVLAVMPSYFAKGYISQANWSELWQESLQVDYIPNVDIRTVKATKKCPNEHLSIIKEVIKVAGYCAKPKNILGDKEWFLEHTRQVANTKQVVMSGLFKHFINQLDVNEEDILKAVNENDDSLSQEENIKVRMNWLRKYERYGMRI